MPKKAATKNPVGRPKTVIDYNLVQRMSEILCTQAEIASVIGCSVDTLQRDKRFRETYYSAQNVGKTSIRRSQFELAQAGNPTMLIWLGKNLLSQRDGGEIRDEETESEKVGVNYTVKEPKGDVNIVKGSG